VFARPVAVPDDLALLRGPVTGVVELPGHLQWSGNARYDLDAPGRIVDLYRTVINEAARPADLHMYLNEAVLVRLWPDMWLPRATRSAWEDRFPRLRQLRPAAA